MNYLETKQFERRATFQQVHAGGWTDEQIAELTRLWAEGLSGSAIAKALGTGLTKNAVIGKVARLNLPPHVRPEAKHPKRSRAARYVRVRRIKDNIAGKSTQPRAQRVPKPGPTPFTATAWQPLAGQIPVSLLDLEPHMCRWPIGDDRPYLFCGAHTDSVYCDEHQRRSYRVVHSEADE